MNRICCECGANENDSGMFPFYRAGKLKYVCFNCMTSHRGFLRYVCPAGSVIRKH